MKGSTYKRCRCRDADGKELGQACPKLKRKDGSWNPRHGGWYFRLELDAGPGYKRRTIRRGGFDSQDAAEDGMDAAKAKEARGVDAMVRLTVGKFLDEWLSSNGGLRRSTELSYGQHIELYLKPHLGHLELDKVRVGHLAEMFDAIDVENEHIVEAAAERKRLRTLVVEARKAKDAKAKQAALELLAAVPAHRRPVGAATKQRIRATLRTALSDAVRQGLITVNVAKLLKLDAGKRPKALLWTAERVKVWQAEYERQAAEPGADRFNVWHYLTRPSSVMVWTPAQTGAFLDQAEGHRLYPLFLIVAFRGLRRGEVCGLGWEDVDLDAATITIRTQRVMVTWSEVEEGKPKTDASEDTIPIDSSTVKALRKHRTAQKEAELEWGEAWVRSGKVFTREDGSALHPDTAFQEFLRVAFAAGLPPIRLHDLRHGAATLMLAGGADMKIVQALLRHSSITITSDTYTSVLPEVAREAAEAAVALVPRKVVGESAGTPGLPTGSQGAGEVRRLPVQSVKRQVRSRSRSGPGGIRTHNLRIKSQSDDVSDDDE